jgi:hypothetical protein
MPELLRDWSLLIDGEAQTGHYKPNADPAHIAASITVLAISSWWKAKNVIGFTRLRRANSA